jgi:hypothetical protein
MVQGYHGTGKSTHIEQVAARLNWPLIRINLDARICFRLGETAYVATVHDGRLDVSRGGCDSCDVTFSGSSSDVAAVIHGGAPFELIRVEGDLELAERFRTLFPLPPKVETS